MGLLISYLNGHEPPSSYTAVKNYIEKHATASIRPLCSQWLADTTYTPQQWVDALRKNNLIDSSDKLFVCQVTRPYQGCLTQEHWDWLNARV